MSRSYVEVTTPSLDGLVLLPRILQAVALFLQILPITLREPSQPILRLGDVVLGLRRNHGHILPDEERNVTINVRPDTTGILDRVSVTLMSFPVHHRQELLRLLRHGMEVHTALVSRRLVMRIIPSVPELVVRTLR